MIFESFARCYASGGTVDYKDVVYKHFFGARSRSALGNLLNCVKCDSTASPPKTQ